MMNLRKFEGKKVRITDTEGETFEGFATDYVFPEDNEPEGEEGITLEKCPQRPYLLGFNESDIKSIEVIS